MWDFIKYFPFMRRYYQETKVRKEDSMDHIQMARAMFGTNMAVHIIFATIGVGLPMMMLAAELMYQRTKDLQYVVMAKRWTKTLGCCLGLGFRLVRLRVYNCHFYGLDSWK